MTADLGNLDRSSLPTMVTSINLGTEHPLILVAVAKHRFLSLSERSQLTIEFEFTLSEYFNSFLFLHQF